MRPPPCSACRGLPEVPIQYSPRTFQTARGIVCPQCREWARVVPAAQVPAWIRRGWLRGEG